MSKFNFDLDPNTPRPPAPGRYQDVMRKIVTLIIVAGVAAGAIYALKYWSTPRQAQPTEQPAPSPLPAEEAFVLPPAIEEPEEVKPVPPEVAEPVLVEPKPEPELETPVAEHPESDLPELSTGQIDLTTHPEDIIDGKGGAVPKADSELQKLFVNAGTALANRDYVQAVELCEKALARPECTQNSPLWRPVADILGKANTALALTPARAPKLKVAHKIVSGDTLDKLAAANGTTREAIQLSNNMRLDDTNIKLGFTLHIYPAKWSIEILTGEQLLLLRNGDKLFKVYDIGVGKSSLTPEGTFKIASRINNPTWYTADGREIPYGDPANVLGTRWMTLEATGTTPSVSGIGIHGTWDEKSVSQAVSNGCIRLRNSDAEELCNLVPLRTPVTIKK